MHRKGKLRIQGKSFVSGNKVMPNGMLKFVPKSNLKWLNKESQERWWQIKEKKE